MEERERGGGRDRERKRRDVRGGGPRKRDYLLERKELSGLGSGALGEYDDGEVILLDGARDLEREQKGITGGKIIAI